MGTVAKVLLYDKHNNVLVLQRSNTHPHYALEADLPGGTIDGNEKPADAAKREVLEEAGIDISALNIQLAHQRVATGGRHDLVYVAHLATSKPEVTISWEHNRYELIPAEKLLDSLDTTDDYMIVVREYLKNIVSSK